MSIPTVFVSYSHDSQEHKKWVLDLATRLRNTGIDAALDQWDLRPGDDLPHFMERNLASSDYVVMVCTENYVTKANNGTGGVGYEKMIITADLLSRIDSNKVIPVIRQAGTNKTPTFLKTKLYIDFSRSDEFEFSFDELVRAIHGAPLYKKPAVGNNPFEPINEGMQEKTNDAVLELMKWIVAYYERGDNYIRYSGLIGSVGKSRVMLDMLIKQAENAGLIIRHGELIYLEEKGKFYAIEHGLVDV